MEKRKKIKKSVWLPAILALYFICMAIFFGPELIRNGESTRFITVSVIEVVIIIACHFFYKHRERNNF
ncbi:hypothetical protein EEL52_12430 [Muribaculaceae bacterium Isolate-113 (HZI)]|uniref:hypothetical protein n=1 Tax=Barnesiella sp. CU968 TaxID=2780099 RepID=UPI000F47912A|nr:hypothetical protein [Barnesiella sp. CU968]MBJ2196439.1 hypothetical protein [Muribaculaceae bacterium]MCI9030446.1 hypothetical protein [Muribaculaceae bacterium]ROT18354.1 hypothetical protein EEL53_12710 [Muribaculaceae bacterium Isolate-114 (HZI)]ROT19192.1 hypothetical protein EEL52_12430 [Muribaculaceae bacterium Isolate-113 (HZI)]